MTQRILCIAPHADDETLGCGGTLLRHLAEGDEVHWLLVTDPKPPLFGEDYIARREAVIARVAAEYGFAATHRLGLAAAGLDRLPEGEVIEALRATIKAVAPDIIYLAHGGDVHSDHRIVFTCAMAALKPFRVGLSVGRILTYETISETEQSVEGAQFRPNSFVNIGTTLERKLALFQLFESETQPYPFPREAGAIRAQARLRGATLGIDYAEAFQVVREVR